MNKLKGSIAYLRPQEKKFYLSIALMAKKHSKHCMALFSAELVSVSLESQASTIVTSRLRANSPGENWLT